MHRREEPCINNGDDDMVLHHCTDRCVRIPIIVFLLGATFSHHVMAGNAGI